MIQQRCSYRCNTELLQLTIADEMKIQFPYLCLTILADTYSRIRVCVYNKYICKISHNK